MQGFVRKELFLFIFFIILFSTSTVIPQEKKQDTIQLIKNYKKEAKRYIANKNYNSAIIELNKANELVQLVNDPLLLAEVKLNIAYLHYNLQNYEKAEREVISSIRIFEKANNQEKLGQSYGVYGYVLTQTGDFQKAEDYLKKADNIFLQLNDEKNRANIILGMAFLNLQKNNPKIALNYFNAVIPFFKNNNLNYEEAYAYVNKAEALLLLNNGKPSSDGELISQAKTSIDLASGIIKKNNFKRLEAQSYRVLSLIASHENNIGQALTYLRISQQKNDSLYTDNLATISEGVDQETLRNKNLKIAKQQVDLDKAKKQINFNKMATFMSIALIVILSLLTLSLYKNNNLRAKANELLKDKNGELLLAKEKAEKASLAKAQFLSTITHELRTPLYAVTGLTHLLLEENPLPHQKEHLNSLKFSGEYLLSLINNILDLNKLEANKVEMEKTSFNLKKRIKDVLIALKKSANDKNNELELDYDDDIPKRLAGDPLKLSQILINLIGNSLKFTQNGTVTVRIKMLEKKRNKATLHFLIEDNGVGISAKKQKTIFETFSQGSLQINRKFGGTGLGLSIVKNLLELMNSKIHLESQLGKGAVFSFKIDFDVAENGSEKQDRLIELENAIDFSLLENKSVLVVEDNKINQMITKKILEKNKLVCMVADNGMDAIKMVKANNFDVILMDIHMPGISGIEATQKIRKFNTEIPIIALTAVTIDENLDEFYRAGFSEIIPKPFKTEEFFQKIYGSLANKNLLVKS